METTFLQYTRAENLKLKHTVMKVLCLLSPIVLIGFAFYLSGSFVLANSYNWWYMALQPVVLSLICCLCINKDRKLKNRAILTLPLKLAKVWDAKVFVCIKFFVCAQLCLLLVLLAVQSMLVYVFHSYVDLIFTVPTSIFAILILTVTSIWQIPLVLTISQKFGFSMAVFLNLLLSTVGSVVMAIEDFWYVNPYAISARLMCVVLKLLPNNLRAEPGSITYSPELVEKGQIIPGVVIAIFWFVLLWIVSRKWYEKRGAKTV